MIMNKIKEIILRNFGSNPSKETADIWRNTENAMKEYAELYCEEFRKNLLKSAYHYENLHAVDFSAVETLPLHPHE